MEMHNCPCGTQVCRLIERGHVKKDGTFLCLRCYKKDEYQRRKQVQSTRSKSRYQDDKDRFLVKNRNYRKTTRGRFSLYKARAKHFGIPFNIDYRQYAELVTLKCFYCGDDNTTGGVDRTDNTRGYVPENVVSCCKTCNFLKRDLFTREQFEFVTKYRLMYRETGFKLPLTGIPLDNFKTPVSKRKRSRWYYFSQKSKKKGLSRSQLEEFIRSNGERCSYCTVNLPETGYCIDQIIPGKGYTIDNIRTACRVCNDIKWDLEVGEAEAVIRALQHHCLENQYTYYFRPRRS